MRSFIHSFVYSGSVRVPDLFSQGALMEEGMMDLHAFLHAFVHSGNTHVPDSFGKRHSWKQV